MSEKEIVPIKIAILTVSDSRTEADDTSGDALVERLKQAGHILAEKLIVADDKYKIREAVSRWIADKDVDVVISTGGTGLTGRDITPEAVIPLFDKEIEGVGELFRWVSYQEIGTSTIASRCIGGLANGTFIFCFPTFHICTLFHKDFFCFYAYSLFRSAHFFRVHLCSPYAHRFSFSCV